MLRFYGVKGERLEPAPMRWWPQRHCRACTQCAEPLQLRVKPAN